MPTTTIYATGTKTGYISRGQNTLTNVRNGPGDQIDLAGYVIVGFERQGAGTSSYMNREGIIGFDTSALPDNALVSAVTLRLSPFNTSIAAARTYRVFAYTPSDPPVTTNYRSQAQVQALTEIGSFTQNVGNSTDHSVTLTGLTVSLTGVTYVLVVDAAFEDGADPAASQNFETWFDGATGATATDPYLEIIYETPPAGESWFFGSGESSMYAWGATRSTVEIATMAAGLDNALTCNIGMDGTDLGASFYNWEGFLRFDTTSLAAGNYTGTLRLYVNTSGGPNSSAVTLRAYAYNGGTIDTNDYQTLAEVQAFSPLIGSIVVPSAASAEYIQLDISGAVTPGGVTSIILISNQFEDQLSLAGENLVQMGGHSATNAAQRPRLSIVSAAAPPGSGNPIGPGTFQAIGSGTLQVRKNGQWVQL